MRSHSHATPDSSFDVAQWAHSSSSTAATPSVQAYPATDIDQTKRVDAMVRNNLAMGIQAKVAIGEPDDQYEQEADRVASQVMSTPDSAVQPVVQRETAPEEEELQMKKAHEGGKSQPLPNASAPSQFDLESQLESGANGGSPLSDDIRTFMEPRFGADFSQVRVHRDDQSIQMNQRLGAQAFTHGTHIYYGAGKAPANDELTGHELTHVLQQNAPQVQQKQLQQPSNHNKEGNLPDDVQEKMERTFNADFSDVKVYENSQSAENLGAVAYTQGNEIHFSSGYQPYSSNGQEYLGHELSHVLQQRQDLVKETHVEDGHSVSDDAALEAQAHEEGHKAAHGEVINTNQTAVNHSSSSAIQKKSQPIQMWRDVPGQVQIESTAPNTEQAWGVFMQAARQSAEGVANSTEPELRRLYYNSISQRMRGSFQPINIDAHTTSGLNAHWVGSIRFVFGDQETSLAGGGTAATTLSGASGSSGAIESSESNTVGSSGSASGGYTAGQNGGYGGTASAGGTGSVATGTRDTQGDTQSAGAASQINQQLNRFSSTIGIEVNITASYDMGSSWTDWVNPAAYGAWGGASLVAGTGNSTGACGTVTYYRGAGIVAAGAGAGR
jgi:hypothetical protein